ncbi:hypothetical protein FMEAI12_4280059 [Parafrankia sp. Ea1.12]|nr:hypothetical protein FMEAI12_4280059 [Parafrankia sp. Ea1.12]
MTPCSMQRRGDATQRETQAIGGRSWSLIISSAPARNSIGESLVVATQQVAGGAKGMRCPG